MKKIYEKSQVRSYLKKTRYERELRDLENHLFVIRYEKGEFVTTPLQNRDLFQVVAEGSLSIYFIRDDGSVYSLADGRENYLIGEMEIFPRHTGNVYAEANEDLVCLAIPIGKCRKKMMESCRFLQLICESLTRKMEMITTLDAAPATLKQRVLTYMKYKCRERELKGLQQAAFHLNCSPRHLQRILNQYEAEGIVTRTGKGAYRLDTPLPEPPGEGLAERQGKQKGRNTV